MTNKRFELKIPLDLLARIEEAARDYFKSPLNHTSKKPELTSPILKLIELGLEKIATDPLTDNNQIDTDKLNALIDERVKEQLSVYYLDDIRTKIALLEQVILASSSQTLSVLNTDINQVENKANISSLTSSGDFDLVDTVLNTDSDNLEAENKAFHPYPSLIEPVSNTDEKNPSPENIIETNSRGLSVLNTDKLKPEAPGENIQNVEHDNLNPDVEKKATSPECPNESKFFVAENIIETNSPALSVSNTDSAQPTVTPHTTSRTEVILNTDQDQSVSVDEVSPGKNPDPQDTPINKLSATTRTSTDALPISAPCVVSGVSLKDVAPTRSNSSVPAPPASVLSPDKAKEPKKENKRVKHGAPFTPITLKGAWKHALTLGFTGTSSDFRNLFSRVGDVHYGVKILYLSRSSSSRNYELLG